MSERMCSSEGAENISGSSRFYGSLVEVVVSREIDLRL